MHADLPAAAAPPPASIPVGYTSCEVVLGAAGDVDLAAAHAEARGPMTAAPSPIPAGSQHAAALHVLGASCVWARTRRFVDDAGEVDWLRLELAAGQWSYGDWLLVCAAHDLDDGTAVAGLRRLCTTLAPHALRRVVEAVLLLRPDAALEPGGGRVR